MLSPSNKIRRGWESVEKVFSIYRCCSGAERGHRSVGSCQISGSCWELQSTAGQGACSVILQQCLIGKLEPFVSIKMISSPVLQDGDIAFWGIYAESLKPYILCKSDFLHIIATVILVFNIQIRSATSGDSKNISLLENALLMQVDIEGWPGSRPWNVHPDGRHFCPQSCSVNPHCPSTHPLCSLSWVSFGKRHCSAWRLPQRPSRHLPEKHSRKGRGRQRWFVIGNHQPSSVQGR